MGNIILENMKLEKNDFGKYEFCVTGSFLYTTLLLFIFPNLSKPYSKLILSLRDSCMNPNIFLFC